VSNIRTVECGGLTFGKSIASILLEKVGINTLNLLRPSLPLDPSLSLSIPLRNRKK
jgi:hypothetical protein